MYNLLAEGASGVLGYGVEKISQINLNFIGDLINKLIGGIGIVGLGIVVFTLILKTIVLPLDIYSRINGKKQALIMERMRPQMEKLQKQYANDKNMYNQKVMELQKKSGYSMFGACLPTIVSLVIFIVVFSAFSTYSQYANLQSYNNMVDVYNGVVISYVYDEDKPDENPDGFLLAVREETEGEEVGKVIDYTVNYERFAATYIKNKKTENPEWALPEGYTDEVEGAFYALAEEYKSSQKKYAAAFDSEIVNFKEDGQLSFEAKQARNTLVSYSLETPAALAVEKYYEEGNDNHFLWVRNIWYPDSMLNKEMPDFSKFKSTITKATVTDADEFSYNKVTANLGDQKGNYNGFFVLIVLSIGFMLLQQWLSMRANKSVNELSTVDGSGAKTNKYMMIMMPIIYGAFSFFYSASFSIYMITNTLYGLITMLIINKCVDIWFKKKEEKGELEAYLTKKQRKPKKVRAGRR